jgi:hypothetical protein
MRIMTFAVERHAGAFPALSRSLLELQNECG